MSPNGSRGLDQMGGSAYDGVFWLTYLANTALMVAVTVLFRYADFVTQAGGNELNLGLIVGIGMFGALAMRVFQGVGIDRFGPRLVWLLSLVLFVIATLGHLLITSVDNAAVYPMRIMMSVSLAGAFGASITFVSLRVPERRVGEMIGMLGTSGFIGMALGPALGDLLFNGEVTRFHVNRMFWLAASAGGVSLVCAAMATRGQLRRKPSLRRRPMPWRLVRRYHAGPLLLVAVAMGVGISMPGTFLRPYTASLGIAGIRTFFWVYAATAFAVRVSTRRLPEFWGTRPMALTGLTFLSVSMLCYMLVRDEWTLAIPACLGGVAHAFLFPSVMSGGSITFPARYRGLAMTLMLAMFDCGVLVGQPAIGFILDSAGAVGLAAYPAMFCALSLLFVVVGTTYAILSRERRRAGAAADATTQPTREEAELFAEPNG